MVWLVVIATVLSKVSKFLFSSYVQSLAIDLCSQYLNKRREYQSGWYFYRAKRELYVLAQRFDFTCSSS